jgi:hypothetical protein
LVELGLAAASPFDCIESADQETEPLLISETPRLFWAQQASLDSMQTGRSLP